MKRCPHCNLEFEAPDAQDLVCPECGLDVDAGLTIDADSESNDELDVGEDLDLDEDFEFDEDFSLDDEVDQNDFETIVPSEATGSTEVQTHLGTESSDFQDDLHLPRKPLDSKPIAETEQDREPQPVVPLTRHQSKDDTAGASAEDDDFELADERNTDVGSEIYSSDITQPTIEIPKDTVTASTLDYAEREIVVVGAKISETKDGDYFIIPDEKTAEIGRGASGVVYRATQRSLGRPVAVKKLKKQVLGGSPSESRKAALQSKDIEKFLYESQITAGLDHPNVITVHDLGVTKDNTLFYSMKLFENGTDWSKVFEKNSLEQNLDVFNDVCDAMRRAHKDRIIHRDLKPQNVLVGDFGEVQVTDWGLAIDLKTTEEFSGGGTPCYMAPEMSRQYLAQVEIRTMAAKLDWTLANSPNSLDEIQYLREKIEEQKDLERQARSQIDERSDVYVMGAILFQIAVGYPPHLFQINELHKREWGSETGKNKVRHEMQMSVNGTIARYVVRNLANPDARQALREIALKAMALEPRDRLQSVAELQQEVRNFRKFLRCVEDTQRGHREVELSRQDSKSYVQLNNAIYAFEGALKEFDNYLPAREGLANARFLFAERALHNQDFELGLSTMTEAEIEQQIDQAPALRLRNDLLLQRKRRDRRKRLLFIATTASLVSIGIGLLSVLAAVTASRIAAEQTNIADLKRAEADQAASDLKVARGKSLEAKESLLVGLNSLKGAVLETIDLKIEAEVADKKLQLVKEEGAVFAIESQLAELKAKIEQQKSQLAIKDAEIASLDQSIADAEKFAAQIESEKVKERTQYDQYRNRLTTIEGNIGQLDAQSELRKLFVDTDISLSVKNSWELHHLYKLAHPQQTAEPQLLNGNFKWMASSQDGGVIIAVTEDDRVWRGSANSIELLPLAIDGLPAQKLVSLDVSADGHWLVLAWNVDNQQAKQYSALPMIIDLKTEQPVVLDTAWMERLRFRSPLPDESGDSCLEKFFCRTQYIQIVGSDEQSMRLLMVDQRAPTGLNQLRCSLLEMKRNGEVWTGEVIKTKGIGQLFLRDPGLLIDSGCLCRGLELADGIVVCAVINSHPEFSLSVFSLQQAAAGLALDLSEDDIRSEQDYFRQMNLHRENLEQLSVDFAPTAIELVELESGSVRVLVGNGKGEIAELVYPSPAGSSFMLAAQSKRLLGHQLLQELQTESRVVQAPLRQFPVARNRLRVLASKAISHQFQPMLQMPIHYSAVRQIKQFGQRLVSVSESEAIIWNSTNDELRVANRYFGQPGKIAAIGVLEAAGQDALLTLSNLQANRGEIRRWAPGNIHHDTTIQLTEFLTDGQTRKKIVSGTADKQTGSKAIGLAFDDGSLEWFEPSQGRIAIDNPTQAQFSNRVDRLTTDDFRNGKFEYFAVRNQLVMYSNSVGLLVWNLSDPYQIDPVRGSDPEGLYTGRAANSANYLAADHLGEHIVTSHPIQRDRFVIWQLQDDKGYVAREMDPSPTERSFAGLTRDVARVVEPFLSPSGELIVCVFRVRNAYKVQIFRTGPSQFLEPLAVYDSDKRTNFRTLHFVNDQHIVLSEERVASSNSSSRGVDASGITRATNLVHLRETDGTWRDERQPLPDAVHDQFRQLSVADVREQADRLVFTGFGIPQSADNELSLLSPPTIDDCDVSTGNRNLLVWDPFNLKYDQSIPFDRRIAPRIWDGQVLFFAPGSRSTSGRLHFANFDNGNRGEAKSIDLSDAAEDSPAARWHALNDGRIVVNGKDWFQLGRLVENEMRVDFRYSLTNPAQRTELAGGTMLVHHRDQSVSVVEVSPNEARTPAKVERVPGLQQFVSLSPDGKHLAFIKTSDGKIGIAAVPIEGGADFERKIVNVDQSAIGLTWLPRQPLEGLGLDIDPQLSYALVSVTRVGQQLLLKVWTPRGEPIAINPQLQTLETSSPLGSQIKAIVWSNVTGEMLSIVWDSVDTTCELWKYSLNQKPEFDQNVMELPRQWFRVDISAAGNVKSLHFSEVIDETVQPEHVAPRIVIGSEKEGSQTVKLFAIRLGLDFQLESATREMFVADRLQRADQMIGAQFSGDGKTLLSLTSDRAQVRLSAGWKETKQDAEFENRIRHFQVQRASAEPDQLHSRKSELIQERQQLTLDQSISKAAEIKQEEFAKAQANVKTMKTELDQETDRIKNELEAEYRREIGKLEENIATTQFEIQELNNSLGFSTNL